MSREKAGDEAQRWLDTARGDLETARVLLTNRRFAHACFHAQQSAAASHREMVPLSRQAAILDRFYVPTRYPNGLPDMIPDQAYFEEDARAAISIAEQILEQAASLAART